MSAAKEFSDARSAKLRTALALLQKGEIRAAKAIYDDILLNEPTQFEALVNSAGAAGQLGDSEEALARFDRALQLDPRNAVLLNNRGFALLQINSPAAALMSFDQAIAARPDFVLAHFNRANTLHGQSRLDDALRGYQDVIRLRPDHAAAFLNRSLVLNEMGRWDEALSSCDRCLEIDPQNADVHCNRAMVLANMHRTSEALDSFARVFAINPRHAGAYCSRAGVLRGRKEFLGALADYDKALSIRPDYWEAHMNRGNLLREMGQPEAAIESFGRALAGNPQYAEAYANRSASLRELNRLAEALDDCDRAISLNPECVSAYAARGDVLRDQKRSLESLDSYDRAIALNPAHAEIHSNRRNALRDLGHYAEALASIDRALSLNPNFVVANCNRGQVLRDLRQPEAALASIEKAIAIDPGYAPAYVARGAILADLGRSHEAVESYDRATLLDASSVEAHRARGDAFVVLRRFEAACMSYERAFALAPDAPFLDGQLRHAKMHLCDWRGLADDIDRISNGILRSETAISPLALLALADSPALQRRAAEIWRRETDQAQNAPSPPFHTEHARIRVGYFSSDLQSHATAYLITGVFEHHDRDRFEITAFSSGPSRQDEYRERIIAACTRFVDVRARSDAQISALARELEIDIAVDLHGYTEGSRSGVFGLRAAPIQVSFLGYPGTMAAECIDYLVADRVVIPPEARGEYSENIVYLPNSYQANDAKRRISDRNFTRSELGLPDRAFVFCCFNNSYKITPQIFHRWMNLLRQLENSVLWLLEDNSTAAANLRKEASQHGVASERLVFAKRTDPSEHLARLRLADLFLDTLPYNAHTTASDALWVGLPIVTCPGKAFASRVAASLLTSIGMPELIASDLDEYEQIAARLARDPPLLAGKKQFLSLNRGIKPLFDTKRFARDLERAYQTMYLRSRRGERAADIGMDEGQKIMAD